MKGSDIQIDDRAEYLEERAREIEAENAFIEIAYRNHLERDREKAN